jgi:hypothetical protein
VARVPGGHRNDPPSNPAGETGPACLPGPWRVRPS